MIILRCETIVASEFRFYLLVLFYESQRIDHHNKWHSRRDNTERVLGNEQEETGSPSHRRGTIMNVMTVSRGVSDRFRPAPSYHGTAAPRPLISHHGEGVHTRIHERAQRVFIFHDHIVQQSQGMSWRESRIREEGRGGEERREGGGAASSRNAREIGVANGGLIAARSRDRNRREKEERKRDERSDSNYVSLTRDFLLSS